MAHDEFAKTFTELQLDETLPITETIVPSDFAGRGSLPLIALGPRGESNKAPTFEVSASLGGGGMGRVLLARQTALGREVAIKTVHENSPSDVADAILQEARTMGVLEHPNIVPVYAIGADEERRPVIVMKRVEGTTWGDAEPEGDPLEWNLRVLLDVCDALAFAHDRGVLHRDIKPDNVMVGAFGEVYLLDWGIAVALDEEDSSFPQANDQIAGTPCYMAPEMTVGDGSRLGVHTDVYLLGAVLSELLTGHPPHGGKTLYEVMLAAYQSKPPSFDGRVDGELEEICRRAMACNPEDRFRTVADFRDAITDYLAHRAANELARESELTLSQLRRSLSDDATPDEVYRHFGASRFGFERALAIWPDGLDARRGLQESLELVARWEISRENASAAAQLLRDLPEPRPDLTDALAELEQRLESRARELEELRHFRGQRDVTVGLGFKRRAAAFGGLLLGVGFSIYPVLDLLGYAYDARLHLSAVVVVAPISLVLRQFAMKHVEDTIVNRRTLRILYPTVWLVLIVRCLTAAANAPHLGLALETLTFGVGFLSLGTAVDGRFGRSGNVLFLGGVILFLLGQAAVYGHPVVLAVAFWAAAVAPLGSEDQQSSPSTSR